MKQKKKTFYGLRLRAEDSEPWGEAQWFERKSDRNASAAFNRVIGGMRTFSFEEKRKLEQTDYEQLNKIV